jgi:hypothetical protein
MSQKTRRITMLINELCIFGLIKEIVVSAQGTNAKNRFQLRK